MKRLLAPALALAALLAWGAPHAQPRPDFPSKGVHVINPFPPGSPVEYVGRLVAQNLEQAWGKYVVVESRSGAGGTVGANYVAKAAPDGHTLLVTTASPISFAAALYEKLPYDPVKDLAPVWGIVTPGQVVVVNSQLPIRTLAELVAYAKANPGKLSYASSGIGTVQHFGGELFQARTGTKLVHVPYRGGAPAATDLAGGHVQVMFDSLTNQLRNIESGKVRPLAILRSRRDGKLPDVPTAAEAGVQGVEVVNWISLFAPAGTPADVLRALRQTTKSVMATPDNVAKLTETFGEAQVLDGEQLARMIPTEARTYIELVERAGIPRQ
ncbi:tripartite tricarboxylate transporter substrate binding protein [Pigmentiphaga sp. H8]|uniref:Bug family tripartite tricarboxylate transporter substrate binding protein n=1 Tax=unclassified Pigmentiphaga TaxID=2626614 RepID=UPI000F5A917B|nr:tripartite tricarboxylate transporter substrate binding protein [Pigmentiphaga sp. H8]AZG10790.1 tripartite tricarboxylate transporter substrate binding protein [Pigmentiphaga sp. H8]